MSLRRIPGVRSRTEGVAAQRRRSVARLEGEVREARDEVAAVRLGVGEMKQSVDALATMQALAAKMEKGDGQSDARG